MVSSPSGLVTSRVRGRTRAYLRSPTSAAEVTENGCDLSFSAGTAAWALLATARLPSSDGPKASEFFLNRVSATDTA